jgi:hypothetical protein
MVSVDSLDSAKESSVATVTSEACGEPGCGIGVVGTAYDIRSLFALERCGCVVCMLRSVPSAVNLGSFVRGEMPPTVIERPTGFGEPAGTLSY